MPIIAFGPRVAEISLPDRCCAPRFTSSVRRRRAASRLAVLSVAPALKRVAVEKERSLARYRGRARRGELGASLHLFRLPILTTRTLVYEPTSFSSDTHQGAAASLACPACGDNIAPSVLIAGRRGAGAVKAVAVSRRTSRGNAAKDVKPRMTNIIDICRTEIEVRRSFVAT